MVTLVAGRRGPVGTDRQLETLLTSFAPASLADAQSVSLLRRIDTKVVTDIPSLHQLLDILLTADGDGFRVVHVANRSASRYETVYFDTPDLRLYRDHHQGRRRRHKVRYRRYRDTNTTFFELKQRVGVNNTEKSRVRVGSIQPTLGAVEHDLLGEHRCEVGDLVPTLAVYYDRVTLLGPNQRVTIDLALRFRSYGGFQVMFDDRAVVEIKDGTFAPNSATRQALRRLNLRSHSMSKYCTGVALAFPVKRNRFIPQLRKLGAIQPGARELCVPGLNPVGGNRGH